MEVKINKEIVNIDLDRTGMEATSKSQRDSQEKRTKARQPLSIFFFFTLLRSYRVNQA